MLQIFFTRRALKGKLDTQRALKGNSGTRRAQGHSGTPALWHSGTQCTWTLEALETLYLADSFINDEVISLDNHSDISEIKNLRLKTPKNIMLSYLNLNSIRNKFKNMSSLVSENVNILIVVETKLDSSFPTAQFLIPGFHHLFRLDINRRSGGLLVCIKWSIPARVLTSFSTSTDTQIIVFEISKRKEKWLMVGIYKPLSLNSQYFLDTLSDFRFLF